MMGGVMIREEYVKYARALAFVEHTFIIYIESARTDLSYRLLMTTYCISNLHIE